MFNRLAAILLTVGTILSLPRQSKPNDSSYVGTETQSVFQGQQPSMYLWAWERSEDLSFINPNKVGVAYLAATFYVSGDHLAVRGRLQPLKVPRGTKLIAVYRIQTEAATLSDQQTEAIVNHILLSSNSRDAVGVQLDFDARKSQRTMYRSLLFALKDRLPPRKHLLITSLASWCMDDYWLADVPVDEAVPMLFRLQTPHNTIANWLQRNHQFGPQCSASTGISTDELFPLDVAKDKTLFVFSPIAWNVNEFSKLNLR